jgi:TetR/AcrR family transcriptional regulator
MREVPAELTEKLVKAADAFATTFDDVRMDEIARASGIPRATLYYYFSGKEEILTFLLEAMLRGFRESSPTARQSDADAGSELAAVMRNQLGYLAAHPATAQLIMANLGRVGKLSDIAAEARETFHTQYERVLADGIKSGQIRRCDIHATSTALFGGVIVTGLQALMRDGDIEVEKLTTALHGLFLRGLTKPRIAAEERLP